MSDNRLMALSVATVLVFFALAFSCHQWSSKRGPAGTYQTMLLVTLSIAAAFVTNYHLSERVLAFCLYGFYPVLLWVAGQRRGNKVVAFLFAAAASFVVLNGAYQYVSIANQWVLNWV